MSSLKKSAGSQGPSGEKKVVNYEKTSEEDWEYLKQLKDSMDKEAKKVRISFEKVGFYYYKSHF
jgi:hypothetical protein